MSWTKAIYVIIIALVYIPMVFLGANVFFPAEDDYYRGSDCYNKVGPAPVDLTPEDRALWTAQNQQCQDEWEDGRLAYESERRTNESYRYVFVTVFNLLVLLLALYLPRLQSSIVLGLFVGSTVATFIATMTYFDTKSKVGFGLLVAIFFVMLYFISKKKDDLGLKKSKKVKKKSKR
jgi:hypothetical protein